MTRIKTAGLFAVVFGILTIVSGGSTLFAGLDMGAVVPFVLWFNFLAGFAYVLAGVGLWREERWAPWLAMVIAAATIIVALSFVIHVARGLPFEPRTVGALTLRCGIWIWIAYLVRPHSNRKAP